MLKCKYCSELFQQESLKWWYKNCKDNTCICKKGSCIDAMMQQPVFQIAIRDSKLISQGWEISK